MVTSNGKTKHKPGSTKWKRRLEASTRVPADHVPVRDASKTGSPPTQEGVLMTENRHSHHTDFKIYPSLEAYKDRRDDHRPGPCRDHFCSQDEKQIYVDSASESFLKDLVYTGEITPAKFNSYDYINSDPSRAFGSLLHHMYFENGAAMAKKRLQVGSDKVVAKVFELKSKGLGAQRFPERSLEV